jgi:hypothetical protein
MGFRLITKFRIVFLLVQRLTCKRFMVSVLSSCLCGTAFFLLTIGCLRAEDIPAPFTIDLPLQADVATPAWLGHPETPATTFAALELPIQPPDTTSSLLVTFVFQEKAGGFLRIMWEGDNAPAELLSDNFYEGIAMGNQRSLLITPETLGNGGILDLQCGDTALGVNKITLQWLTTQSGLVSPEIQDTLVTSALGTTQPATLLNGQPPSANPAAWKNQIVVVPIIDTPQRIEEGVEYNVQLDSLPTAGRLVFKEDGLPWGKHLVLWVNQQRVGTITPAVPDLLNDGFLSGTDLATAFVGWREASTYVPVSSLKAGTDSILISMEDDMEAAKTASGTSSTTSATTAPPLAIKDFVLQLSYPPSSSSTSSSLSSPTPVSTAVPDLSVPGAVSAAASGTDSTTNSP